MESLQGHILQALVSDGIHEICFQSPFGDEGLSASDKNLLHIQAGVQLAVRLAQPSKCWDCRGILSQHACFRV